MKLAYFLIWLAGGGLVILATYVGRCLLKSAERLNDAHDGRLWQDLIHPDQPQS
jgi:hypothetical protein